MLSNLLFALSNLFFIFPFEIARYARDVTTQFLVLTMAFMAADCHLMQYHTTNATPWAVFIISAREILELVFVGRLVYLYLKRYGFTNFGLWKEDSRTQAFRRFAFTLIILSFPPWICSSNPILHTTSNLFWNIIAYITAAAFLNVVIYNENH